MKLARIRTATGVSWASVEEQTLVPLDGDPFGPRGVTGLRIAGGPIGIGGAVVLTPVVPSKIVAVGLNYRDHALERGKPVPEEPLLFLKPPSAVVGHGDPIEVPLWAGRVDHEAECAIVIGRTAHRLANPREALAAILGFTCTVDVTARDLQTRDVQFTRAKGFDSFCPLGPWIRVGAELSDAGIEGRVNGEVRQRSRTSQMVFSPPDLVRFVSRVMTLLPGDVILTGTPSGIGPLRPGDQMEVEIEGIGVLRNPVTAAPG